MARPLRETLPIQPGDWETVSQYLAQVPLDFPVTRYGAKGDGVTDDTAAIQAAIDDAFAVHGTVTIPTSLNPYMFTNLKVGAKMSIRGVGFGTQTILKRIPGSTGTAIRERTIAEGNPLGCTGFQMSQLGIYGNNTTGDGLDLGNQVPGAQMNFEASLQNVEARDFPSGIGFKLNCNAIYNSHLWANANQTGFQISGGSNTFVGLWSQGNSTYNYQIQSSGDTFTGMYLEGSAAIGASAQPFIRIEGSQNRFNGIQMNQFFGNRTGNGLIFIATGANRNCFFGVCADTTGGFTFNNVIYVEAQLFGTGSSDYLITEFLDQQGMSSWHYNSLSSARLETRGGALKVGGQYNAPMTVVAILAATATWDPPSVGAGAQTTTTIAVSQASIGDLVDVGFNKDLQGMQLTGYVSTAGTVTVVLRNGTAGAIDLASGTLRVGVTVF